MPSLIGQFGCMVQFPRRGICASQDYKTAGALLREQTPELPPHTNPEYEVNLSDEPLVTRGTQTLPHHSSGAWQIKVPLMLPCRSALCKEIDSRKARTGEIDCWAAADRLCGAPTGRGDDRLPHPDPRPKERRPTLPSIQHARIGQPDQVGNQPRGGAGAMAQAGLDPQPQLTKRAVILDNLEQRIVAEPLTAAGLEEDSPATGGLAFRLNLAGRIGDGDVANESCRTLLQGELAQLLQEQTIVRFVRGIGSE